MIKRTAPLILLILLSSCEARRTAPPPGVIPPEDFAALYVDLLKLGVRTPSAPADTLSSHRRVDSLLQVHNATRELVTKSVGWYNQDVAQWRLIMDSVTTRLERERAIRP